MAIQKTNAIVLKTQPFRSSSLIATFFTESFGKVKGLAKGVRQEREIRGAPYDLFTMVEIIYYEKTRSDIHLISDCVTVNAYPLLKVHLEGIAYASYFCELAEQLTEVHDPNPEIFRLLDFSFRYLSAIPGMRIARLFEIKLLHEVGWLPHVDACLGCEKTEIEQGFFSARQGALYCKNCCRNIPDVQPISPETLSVMRYYIHHDLETCLKQGMTRQAEQGLENLMGRFFQDRLNAPLKTLQFLSKIKPILK